MSTSPKLKQALDLLRKLEWSGRSKGPSSAMHLNDGYWFRSCPNCGGICPHDPWEGSWIKEAVGHKTSCALQRLLTK